MRTMILAFVMCIGLQVQAVHFTAVTDAANEASDEQLVFNSQIEQEVNYSAINRPPPIPIPGQCVCYVEDWHRRIYEGRDWDCGRAERDALARCERHARRCYYMGCERRSPF